MQDAWRAYLEMALGLTETPRKRAQQVAGELVNRGGATAVQLQGLVEDLLSTGVANREALTNIVRFEVDRALGLVGLATADEVADLNGRVRDLERQLRQAQAAAAPAGATGAAEVTLAEPGPVDVVPPAKAVPPVKKTVAKKALANKAVKATPNAMPAAAVPGRKAAKTTPGAAPAKATGRPAKVAKAAPVEQTTPEGTVASPTAAVKEAAAATELPPAKKAAKRAPAKKAAKKTTDTSTPEAKP
jgi:polyhydroxyalkanoate synthesis regulator phasin